jgi:hypothetical protein
MNLEKWKQIAAICEILGSSLFFLLIFIAMFFYTGGTMDNPSSPGYYFWGNTISDLGRIISYNGGFNIIAMVLFTIAITALALLSIPLYIVFPKIFSIHKFEAISAKIGSLLGYITTIGWIGVIFFPADISNDIHWLFAYIIYIAFFLSGVFYTISLFLNKKISKTYVIIFTLYCIIHFTSLMIIIIGLPISRTYLVVGQKIAHISSLISYIILGYGLLKYKLD